MAHRATITTLTPEQEAQIPVWREAWRTIGLSTERIVPDEARSAVRDLYSAAGLRPPKTVFLAPSPMRALRMRADLLASTKVGEGALRWGQLWDRLMGQLETPLRAELWDQMRWWQIERQLRVQILDPLAFQLRVQLGRHLWDQISHEVDTARMIGGWDGCWLAYYEAGRAVGATYPEALDRHLDAYSRYAKTCGVAFCYRDVAFVSDRPTIARFDEGRRLHAEDGPALAWSDGHGVFAWHGYRLPETHHWTLTDKARLTPAAVLAERNAELRRVMCEIVGWEAMLSALGARVIAEDENCGQPRRLLAAEIAGDPVRILHVVNGSLEPDGTRREFFLGALSEARTPHEAVAMSYGRAPRSYAEAGRT